MADGTLPTQADVESYFKRLNNWGRWGHDDQVGTVNLVTPAKRAAAQRLVREHGEGLGQQAAGRTGFSRRHHREVGDLRRRHGVSNVDLHLRERGLVYLGFVELRGGVRVVVGLRVVGVIHGRVLQVVFQVAVGLQITVGFHARLHAVVRQLFVACTSCSTGMLSQSLSVLNGPCKSAPSYS